MIFGEVLVTDSNLGGEKWWYLWFNELLYLTSENYYSKYYLSLKTLLFIFFDLLEGKYHFTTK